MIPFYKYKDVLSFECLVYVYTVIQQIFQIRRNFVPTLIKFHQDIVTTTTTTTIEPKKT